MPHKNLIHFKSLKNFSFAFNEGKVLPIFLTDFCKMVLRKMSRAILFLFLPKGRINYIHVSADGCLSNWS